VLQKQLGLWRNLIIRYHSVNKIKQLLVYDCELWRNEDIDRGLDRDEIKRVVDDFVKSGHGEWEDTAHTRIKVLWKKPGESSQGPPPSPSV
jgi:ESCRT-II complex subunit VPS25